MLGLRSAGLTRTMSSIAIASELIDDVANDAPYDAVIVAVKHEIFVSMFPLEKLRAISVDSRPVLVDVKSSV